MLIKINNNWYIANFHFIKWILELNEHKNISISKRIAYDWLQTLNTK